MSLLKKIQEHGFQDFPSLANAVRKAGLGSTDLGYIYSGSIVSWFKHSFGMDDTEAKELYNALINMGFLRENSYGNVYPHS